MKTLEGMWTFEKKTMPLRMVISVVILIRLYDVGNINRCSRDEKCLRKLTSKMGENYESRKVRREISREQNF